MGTKKERHIARVKRGKRTIEQKYQEGYYENNREAILSGAKKRYDTDPEYREGVKKRARTRARGLRTSTARVKPPIKLLASTKAANRLLAHVVSGELYPLRLLANALNRDKSTITYWIERGILPKPERGLVRGSWALLYRGDVMKKIIRAYLATDFTGKFRLSDTDFPKKVRRALPNFPYNEGGN